MWHILLYLSRVGTVSFCILVRRFNVNLGFLQLRSTIILKFLFLFFLLLTKIILSKSFQIFQKFIVLVAISCRGWLRLDCERMLMLWFFILCTYNRIWVIILIDSIWIILVYKFIHITRCGTCSRVRKIMKRFEKMIIIIILRSLSCDNITVCNLCYRIIILSASIAETWCRFLFFVSKICGMIN